MNPSDTATFIMLNPVAPSLYTSKSEDLPVVAYVSLAVVLLLVLLSARYAFPRNPPS